MNQFLVHSRLVEDHGEIRVDVRIGRWPREWIVWGFYPDPETAAAATPEALLAGRTAVVRGPEAGQSAGHPALRWKRTAP